MTKEKCDKTVAPVESRSEEIKEKPKTIIEYVEDVWGHRLSKCQKNFITATYEYYKANRFGMDRLYFHGSATINIVPILVVAFAAYEENELY